MSKILRNAVLLFAGSLLFATLAMLWRFAQAPGEPAGALASWPPASQLMRSTERYSLLMFLHPKCNCSEASLGELAKLLTSFGKQVQATAVFVGEPASSSSLSGKLWETAKDIPGLQLKADPTGREAGLFKASTSGQTYLFSPSGALLFAGGITAARGHYGDNAGSATLSQLLLLPPPRPAGTSQQLASALVFGCELLGGGTNHEP